MDKYFEVLKSIAKEFGSLSVKSEVSGAIVNSSFTIRGKEATYRFIAVAETACFSIIYNEQSVKDIINEEYGCPIHYSEEIIDAINEYR